MGRSAQAFRVGLAALVLVSAFPTTASAGTYQNGVAHYRFDYPGTWSSNNTSGPPFDTVIRGPDTFGYIPNIVAVHNVEPNATDDAGWLSDFVWASYRSIRSNFTIVEVLGPRTFSTASGRLAGDYMFERWVNATYLRQRQVFFVSGFHQRTYILTFTDNASTYDLHGTEWTEAVDSFTVEGEPVAPAAAAPFPLALVVVVGAGGAAVAAAIGLVVVRKRKRAQVALARQRAKDASAYGMRQLAPTRTVPGTRPPTVAAWSAPQAPKAPTPTGFEARDLPDDTDVAELPPSYRPPPTPPRPVSRASPPPAEVPAPATAPPPPPKPTVSPALAAAEPPRKTPPPPAAPARASMIRCPKCKNQFPGPAARPAMVECPTCGTKGMMR